MNTTKIKINPHELEIGIKVEKEHTSDEKEAKKIAMDHLKEKPNYYTRLNKCKIIDEPEAKKLAKKYQVNEHQFKLIAENIVTEEPDLFDKGDKLKLLAPIEGYDVPLNKIGTVIHVDAIGTTRTEFIVNGLKIIVPIDPEVDHIQKIQSFSQTKSDFVQNFIQEKKSLTEIFDLLSESKQTEQQAITILKRIANIDDTVITQTIDTFRQSDTTKNQALLPIMASALMERASNGGQVQSYVNEISTLFASIARMVNENKLQMPTKNSPSGYTIGNKSFPDYLKMAEFIHGVEHMSKGFAEWKGAIQVETDESPIWEGNGIKVYDGNDVGKCIHYTTGALTGKHYGFCIGQPANTMWQSYRDTKTSTFYYVVDENRDLNDPLHLVVLDNTQYGIELTDVNNSTGRIAEFGTDVNGYLDYLKSKGIPTDKLVNKPPTPEEKEEQSKLGYTNEKLDWFKRLSFQEQSKYIGRGHKLSDEQFNYLWNFKNNQGAYHLLHQYVDTGQALPANQFATLVSEGN